jgi:hypothetical protein
MSSLSLSSLQRYQGQPLGQTQLFIARFAPVEQAARHLRPAGAEKIAALFNGTDFPPTRSAQLLKHLAYPELFSRLNQTVSQAYLELCGQELIAGLRGDNLRIATELAPFFTSQLRDAALSRLEQNDPEQRVLRFELKAGAALELIDRVLSSLPKISPQSESTGRLLREALEYFPCFSGVLHDRPSGKPILELNAPRDRSQLGIAPELMRTLLLNNEITETEIKLVYDSSYCRQRPSRQPAYRDFEVYRGEIGPNNILLPHHQVPKAVARLVDWVNSDRVRAYHPFVRAVGFYLRYDRIHPFVNRTKQVGRFMMAKILLQGKDGLRYPPLIDQHYFNAMVIGVPDFLGYEYREDVRNGNFLIRHGLESQLVCQLVALYIDSLRQYLMDNELANDFPELQQAKQIICSEQDHLWRSDRDY